MSAVVVRPARPDELDAAGACVRAAYDAEGLASEHYGAKLADARARAVDAEVLVAVDGDGTVLGTVTFALAGSSWADVAAPGEAELRMLGVDPAARGRGVGEALARACVARARASGANRVVLSTQTGMAGAHRSYARLGSTRVPELDRVPEPGVALLGLALELPAGDRAS